MKYQVCLILLICFLPGRELSAEDAIPNFRKLLDESEYHSRAAQFEESMKLIREQSESKRPSIGLRFTKIVPDSQAEAGGLEVGDILVRANEYILANGSSSILDMEGTRTLHIYRHRQDQIYEIEVEEGLIGVSWSENWQPELHYLRSKNRGKWDRDVLVGCLARLEDPDLAETAWHRAMQAGYQPDLLSTQMGIDLANKQYRADEAIKLARSLNLEDPSIPEVIHPYTLYLAATASSDYALMRKILEVWPYSFEVDSQFIAYMERRQKELSHRWGQNVLIPSEFVKSMYADDILPNSRATLYHAAVKALPKWQRGEPVHVERDTGHYEVYRFGPPYPVPNFELSMRFIIKPTNVRGSRFAKAININLKSEPGLTNFDREPSEEQDLMSLRLHYEVDVEEPGSVIITELFDDEFVTYRTDKNLKFDGKTTHELRILRCQGMGEMLVNGKRVFLGPVSEEKGTGFFIQLVGVTADITEVKCVEYIAREVNRLESSRKKRP